MRTGDRGPTHIKYLSSGPYQADTERGSRQSFTASPGKPLPVGRTPIIFIV